MFKKKEDEIIFDGMIDGDIKKVVTDYFDLNRDYLKIKEVNKKLKSALFALFTANKADFNFLSSLHKTVILIL